MGQFVQTNKDRYIHTLFVKQFQVCAHSRPKGQLWARAWLKKYCLNYDILVAFYPLYMLQHKVMCLYENVGIFDKAKN